VSFLQDIEFVGTFRNAQIGSGKKSVTLALLFRDPASTLRSEQVDQQVVAVLAVLSERCNAILRN
jgi:phenylalanyl-tRNA synthetase beta subunit